jgi:hypothetical protein
MDGTGDHHVKQNKSDSERQVLHVFSHRQNLGLKNDINVKGDCFGGEPSEGERAKGENDGVNMIKVLFMHV